MIYSSNDIVDLSRVNDVVTLFTIRLESTMSWHLTATSCRDRETTPPRKAGWAGPGSAVVSHGMEMRSIGRVEYQPRPKSIGEAMMKVFHKLTKKKDRHG